jgi:cell division topological specificity factor
MSLFKYLRKKKSSANVAKERLQIIISHERSQRTSPEYLKKMQEEILEVIAKYVKIDREKVNVHLEKLGDNAVLELNVTMPEEALEEATSD